jgi:hypothetical protein
MAFIRQIKAADGGSRANRLGFLCLLLLSCLAFLASAQDAPDKPTTGDPPQPPSLNEILQMDEAVRDSLLQEIQRYSKMINAMRDSLNLSELGLGLELGPQQKQSIQRSIDNFTVLVEEIGQELGDMDLEIVDNRISLLDKQGEGIVINIPENLDESLSEGLNVLSKLILSELPDSLEVQGEMRDISFHPFGRKKEKRKVHTGNLVRVGDPLQVTDREDIRGHVVAIFGDAEVSGRVDGDVVVVFGDLQLGADAEVTGKVVTVGGRLAQDPDAEVADVMVIDPWSRLGLEDGPEGLLQPGLLSFLVGQGEFMVMVLLAILAVAFAPPERLDRARQVLAGRPLFCLVAGMLGSLGLHLLALMAMAILVATVIGIPVALLVAVAVFFVGIMAVGLVGLELGRRICTGLSGRCGAPWSQMLVGLIALHTIAFLGQVAGLVPALAAVATPLVLLGFGLKAGAYFFGLGAIILSRLGSRR